MKPGMVTDLMALAVHPLHYPDVVLRLRANHEEGSNHVVLSQDVENLRRPGWIWPVIEAQGDFLCVISGLLHRVGERIGTHRLSGDRSEEHSSELQSLRH